jgi:hypothetical protein
VLIGKSKHYLKTLTPAHQKREMPASQNQSSTIFIIIATTKQYERLSNHTAGHDNNAE